MTSSERMPENLGLNDQIVSYDTPSLGWDPFRFPELKPVTIEEAIASAEESIALKKQREWDDTLNPEKHSRLDINNRSDFLPLSHFFPRII